MIQVNDLHFTYQRGFSITIKEFSLSPGQSVMIKGPSGCGKSTFLKLIRGNLQPAKGEVVVLGQNLTNLIEKKRRRIRLQNIGSIFQDCTLLPYLNVEDNLRINYFLGDRKLNHIKSHPLIEQMGIKELLHKYPNELSGGEAQRVALIRPFLHAPKLIVADEPTNHLDQVHKDYLISLLKDFLSKDTAVLIVSHDEYLKPHFNKVVDFMRLKN